jgi:cell division protein FtsI/penicillin-binding protein 2
LLRKQKPVHFYHALYSTAFFNHNESEQFLSRISAGQQQPLSQAIDLIKKLNSKLKAGTVDYIFDKNGSPLAHYNLKNRKTISVTPGMVFDDFTPRFENGIKTYTLSLDLNVQHYLDRIFKNHSGSMILFKIEDSSILAAYSKPRNRANDNTVFTSEFEPGSIMKILTLFAFFLNPEKTLFPMECRQSIRLSNRDFPDRTAHGSIDNPLYALAVSCNLAFARMGIAVGFKRLSRVLDSFFFNSKGFSDRFIRFKTGHFNRNVIDDYQLANLSVGLNEITTTTFHSGLIAMIIAQNGSINKPYLIKNVKNMLNLGFYNHQPRLVTVFDNNPIFLKISQAMVDVVENRQGTGRHSKVEFVKTAIKTGTAGEKRQGLNAIIIGFFPAEKPEYAFGFFLEGAGKAELKGAYFLKEFLKLIRDQIK